MFDLDTAICEWRRQMAAGGIKASAVLDELENHLREDLERQMPSGTAGQTAFDAAVKKIGPPAALKSEFRKSGGTAAALEKLMMAVAALFVAFGIFLTSVTLILCYASFGERFAGFSGFGALLLAVFGLPQAASFLPTIENKRKRLAIEILCLLLGFGATTFYVQVILPVFDFRRDGMIAAMGFWGDRVGSCCRPRTGHPPAAGANWRVSNQLSARPNNMFDLDQAIAEWRRQMLAAGIQSPVPLDELENHLREDVDRSIRFGVGEDHAFRTAMEQIGDPGALNAEFARVENQERKYMKRGIIIGVGILGVLVGMALVMPAVAQYRHDGTMTNGEPWLFLIGSLLTLAGCGAAIRGAKKSRA